MAAFAAPLPLPDGLRPERWRADRLGGAGQFQAGPAAGRRMLGGAGQPGLVPRAPGGDARDGGAGVARRAGRPGRGTAAPPIHAAAHRWRYSLVEVPLGRPCLADAALGLGLAGDWCLAGRAEAAFDSGTALAAALLA